MEGEITRLNRDIAYLQQKLQLKDTEIRNGFQTNEALRKELNGRINDLEKQNQELRTQLNNRQHGGTSDSLKDMRKQLEESEKMNIKVKQFNVKLRERKEMSDQNVKELQEHLRLLQSEKGSDYRYNGNADIRREITKLNAQVQKLNDENYKLVIDKRTDERKITTLQEMCQNKQKENERVSRYADNLKRDLELRRKAHESLIVRTKEEVDSEQECDIKKHSEELNALAAKLESDRQDIHIQRERLRVARKEQTDIIQKLTEEKNHLTMENDEINKKLSQLEQKCEQMEREKVSKRTRICSGPDSSSTFESSQRSYRSHSDVHQLLNTHAVMVTQLQQQVMHFQSELRRVEDQNYHYRENAGKLKTTLREYSGSIGDGQTLNILAEKVAALLQLDNHKSHQHKYNFPSYPSSEYPPIKPFKLKETHHNLLDLTKPFPTEDSNES